MMSFWVVPWSCVRPDALLLGRDDVERQQPRRRRVDRHRRVHLAERDAVQQRRHVAAVRDRHADLADLAARELVVGVVARLRRQVERYGEPGLALGQVAPVQLVGLRRGGVPRVGPDHPRPVALGQAVRHEPRILTRESTALGGGLFGAAVAVLRVNRVGSCRCGRSMCVHKGQEKVICCWEVDGVLIDPGPGISEETLLAALDGERPRALLLTHIHFDHAGVDRLARERWPDLPVYVHERGAPHMVDPARLVASAGAALRRRRGPAAAVGRDACRCPRRTCGCSRAARRHRGRVPGRVHARPRLPPRLLLPRADGLGVRRRHRRRPDPAARASRSRRRRRRTSTSWPGSARSRRSAPGSRRVSASRTSAPSRRRRAARRVPGGPARPGRARGRARRGGLRRRDGRARQRGLRRGRGAMIQATPLDQLHMGLARWRKKFGGA